MKRRPQLPVNCHSKLMNSYKSPSTVKNLLFPFIRSQRLIPSPSTFHFFLFEWEFMLFLFSIFFCVYSQTAPAVHEHKSNVTSTEKTLTFPINQTTIHKADDAQQHNVIPDFKKISTNFTSFIDDLLHRNVLEETSTTTKVPSTTSTPTTTLTTQSSTSKPFKSIINDDDFIIKHLKAPAAPAAVKHTQGLTEIFSKHTSPTMNGLLKLAGCNIYGQVRKINWHYQFAVFNTFCLFAQMYDVGQSIAELSNDCLECKCLPDIGVGCTPKC